MKVLSPVDFKRAFVWAISRGHSAFVRMCLESAGKALLGNVVVVIIIIIIIIKFS